MVTEELVQALEQGERETVEASLSLSFPSRYRVRAMKALFRYALAQGDVAAMKRAVYLATRETVQDDLLVFLGPKASPELKLAALRALAQKGPYKTCTEPLQAAVLDLIARATQRYPESVEVGIQAVVAAVSLGMKKAPEKIPGSLLVVRATLLRELSKLVSYWQPYDDKSLYRAVVKVLS